MEIIIRPNWSSDAYIPIDGIYSVPTQSAKVWTFISSVEFNLNDILRISMGGTWVYKTYVAMVRVRQVLQSGSNWIIRVDILSGKLSTTLNIIKVETVYDDKTFYLDGVIDIELNMRVYDLKEMKRASTYTKTIDIPFTKNNNKIFSQLYNVNVGDGFNPKKKSDCLITDGGVLISSGYLQLQEVDTPNKLYKCVFYGENKNLFDDIGDNLIVGNDEPSNDVDLSDWKHSKYKSVIEGSWNNEYPYVYGLVYDESNQHTIQSLSGTTSLIVGITFSAPTTYYHQLKPHVRAKSLLDKIFQKWEYQYESTFLNSDYFNNVMVITQAIPHVNGDFVISYTTTATHSLTGLAYNIFPVDTKVTDIFGSSYNAPTGKFTVPYRGYYSLNMNFTIKGVNNNLTNYPTQLQAEENRDRVQIYMKIDRNSATIFNGVIFEKVSSVFFGFNNQAWYVNNYFDINNLNGIFQDIPLRLQSGDEVYFYVYISSVDGTSPLYNYNIPGVPTPTIGIRGDKDNITLDYLFEGIKQKDFVGDMFKMFNLYIKPDKSRPKLFLIEPRDEFYATGSNVNDLQYDRDEFNVSYLLDTAAGKYTMTYKPGGDLANKTYQAQNTDRIYGDAKVELDADFLTDENKIELNAVPTQFRWINNEVAFPSLEGADNKNQLRYYMYNGTVSISSFTFSIAVFEDEIQWNFAYYTYYPAFSNYEIWNNSDSRSLLFATRFDTSKKEKSLYYEYYQNEVETYADPHSHILTLKVRMNSSIYSRIDWNDIYYFEVEGNGHYYTLLSIDGYIPNEEHITTMKFLTYYDFKDDKPKRTRNITKGIKANLNYVDSEMYPINIPDGPVKVSGSGNIVVSGTGQVIGEDNVLSGNNNNVFVSGNNVILSENVSRTNIISGSNLRVGANNIFSIGGVDKVLGATDSVYINDHYMDWDQYDIETIPGPTAGIMVMDGNDDIVFIDASGNPKSLNPYYIEETLVDNLLIATSSWNSVFGVTMSPVGTWIITANITAGINNGFSGPTEITITGTQNKLNKDFTLSHAVSSHQFFINGQLMTYGEDYTITGTSLRLLTIPPDPSDKLRLFMTAGGAQSYAIRMTSGATTLNNGILIVPEYGINTLTLVGVLENVGNTASTCEVDIYGTTQENNYVYADYTRFVAHRIY